jgi:hypothetical protein
MPTSSAKKPRASRQLELPVVERSSRDEDAAAERAAAIVESLPTLSGEQVFEAFEKLDDLPPAVVKEALTPSTGPAPDLDRLDDMTRRAHGFPPRPLRLRTVAIVRDADIFDLGPVAEEQLRTAGRAWDGADLSAEERLDGEADGTFAGTLEHHVLCDADAPGVVPMYDVLLYANDAGSIFRAGTTELVGAIAYGTVEMKDRRARSAIQHALAVPFETAPSFDDAPTIEIRPESPVKTRTKTVKKTAAKTPAPKKATAKKAAAKTPVPKKSAAKTPASRKAAAKAPASKKAAAKKAAPKKAAPKKTAAVEKTPAKKKSAKKSAKK